MQFYEQLPDDFLVLFYHEIIKTIRAGRSNESTLHELRLITSVMKNRGISFEKPAISA
ncbi:hypothetical protein [Aquibacillus kalidii]|uniref:hypothetical protein n=1 Tax=Aquibacillus kalidii TaxID=2762597 RepID=UPI001646F799|nr:hypothetical protein [Aquibacillus kalidii]